MSLNSPNEDFSDLIGDISEPTLDPDTEQAKRFLALLDPKAEAFTFQTFDDVVLDGKKRGDKSLVKVLHGSLEQHADALTALNRRGAGVYVMVQEGDGITKGRSCRTNDNVIRIRDVFQEDDGDGKQLPLEPHILVESSPGKRHSHLLCEGLSKEDFANVMKVMISQYGSDPNAKDLARVLRVPGFYHHKGEPFMVNIAHESGSLPFTRDQIMEAFQPIQEEPKEEPQPLDAHFDLKKVRKLAFEAAERTHLDPTVGRHKEIYTLGSIIRRELGDIDAEILDEALKVFEANMRPTDSAGKTAKINWENERKAIRDGYFNPSEEDRPKADPETDRLHAELRRLASLDPAVFLTCAKEEAKKLGMPVKDLRQLVSKAKNRSKTRSGVDIDTPLPRVKEDGFPRNHLDNLREILRRLEVTVRYNLIKKREEILVPGSSYTPDNSDNSSFAWLESECSLFDFPTSKLGGFITEIADRNPFNPVVTWVTSSPWDGTSRLDELFDTLQCAPRHVALKRTLLTRWLLSAIAVAFSPNGCQTRGTLVLQGDQSLGKTRWLMSLAPPDLEVIKEGHLLKPENKDSVTTAVSHWIVELGELDATFRKSDIAALNGFLTNMSDIVRRPYARKDSHYARRTVFAGSVNPTDFLHDPTGSTRFWVIPVTAVNHAHSVDMQQVWAEVLTMWQSGEQHWLTPDESRMLADSNRDFETACPVDERLGMYLAWDAPQDTWIETSITGLLVRLGLEKPTKAELNSAGTALRKKGLTDSTRNKHSRLWRVPPLATVDAARSFREAPAAEPEDFAEVTK